MKYLYIAILLLAAAGLADIVFLNHPEIKFSVSSFPGDVSILGSLGINTTTPASTLTVNGNVNATSRIFLKNTNGAADTCTLSGGTCTISNSGVTANTIIVCTTQSGTLNLGDLHITSRTAGTSYVVTSANALDASTVGCILVEPTA